MKEKNRTKIIIQILVLLGIVATGLFGFWRKGTKKSPTVYNEIKIDSGSVAQSQNGNANVVGRDQYNAPVTINSTPAQTSPTSKQSAVPKSAIDQSVKSYNAQPGSVTTYNYNVKVAEEEGIDIAENYETSAWIERGIYFIKINPKYGEWKRTFVAWPMSDSNKIWILGLTLNAETGQRMIGGIPYNFDSAPLQTSKVNPCVIRADRKPTVLLFGDVDNPKKIYTFK